MSDIKETTLRRFVVQQVEPTPVKTIERGGNIHDVMIIHLNKDNEPDDGERVFMAFSDDREMGYCCYRAKGVLKNFYVRLAYSSDVETD